MEKKIVQVPIYEQRPVQVGTREKEVWVTADGKEFNSKQEAVEHEFNLSIRKSEVTLPYELTLYYFESPQQVFEWKEKLDEYHIPMFNEEKFDYPNWFVVFETSGPNDDYMVYYDMKYFDDFKADIIDLLDKAKK
jgi:hypothetical protein